MSSTKHLTDEKLAVRPIMQIMNVGL